MRSVHSCSGTRRSGTVLIVAMWIVLVLAGLTLVFARAMRVEMLASANDVAARQAEAAAQAALAALLSQVDQTDGTIRPDLGAAGEAVPVGDGYFWVLNASPDDDTTYGYGVRDEASRVNLNTAPTDVLMGLPGMTSDLAASIVDWRDGDDNVSPGGAESEYYLLLEDPYYCKNAPFESVEELLLVKGATAELLYGEDANRNGVLDPNENDAADRDPPDNRDGKLDRGLAAWLTVYSVEPNVDVDGQPRVNVNDAGGQALSDLLREVVAGDRFFQTMDRVRSGRPFRNLLDFRARTGLTANEFALIADRLTTTSARMIQGLVNVNTAPRQVLLCLPGLEPSDVEALIERRSSPDADLFTIGWVAGALTPEKAAGIGGLITTRSFQFSADIVAVDGRGRAFRRYRAVVDARSSPPVVRCWKDLTHLGWPLLPETLDSLRRGTFSVTDTAVLSLGAM